MLKQTKMTGKKTIALIAIMFCFFIQSSATLAAITSANFAAIREAYPGLNLSPNMSDYNFIEITSLSEANLRNAITLAGNTASDDIIVVRTTGGTTITLSGTEIGINIDYATKGSVTIVSLGTNATRLIIDGNASSRIFNIQSSYVNLGGIVITNGRIAGTGPGPAPNLTGKGAGICAYKSNLVLDSCDICENEITGPGSGSGGGIYSEATSLANTFLNGIPKAQLVLFHCMVAQNQIDNSSQGYGGGIYSDYMKMYDSTIEENNIDGGTWALGGGVYIGGLSSSPRQGSFYDSIISGNHVQAKQDMYYTEFRTEGGGIYGRNLNIDNCEITGNLVIGKHSSSGFNYNQGGGISGVDVHIENSLVSQNVIDAEGWWYQYGGGIYATNLIAKNCVVSENNVITGDRVFGGGVFSSGNMTLDSCVVSNNSAPNGGGVASGLDLGNGGSALIFNCLIANNEATGNTKHPANNAKGAGAIALNKSGLTIHNSTIVDNTSAIGTGGIGGSGFSMYNTIVAFNSGNQFFDHNNPTVNVTVQGCNNLVSHGGGLSTTGILHGVNGNMIGTSQNPIDPKFISRSSGNYRLLRTSTVSSPAINAGNNSYAIDPSGMGTPLLTDLDGHARIVNVTVDIGAYENQGTYTASSSSYSSEVREQQEMSSLNYWYDFFADPFR